MTLYLGNNNKGNNKDDDENNINNNLMVYSEDNVAWFTSLHFGVNPNFCLVTKLSLHTATKRTRMAVKATTFHCRNFKIKIILHVCR